ncbi:MAG: SPOR domain-containing protein [Rhodoferax sp.]|nr:SPOR domain-containing protein [Rhodoferax sp.]
MVLLVLNLGYYTWGQGWLLAYGWGPSQQREPQRMAQQVHPETITVLGSNDIAPASELAPQPTASPVGLASSDVPAPRESTVCWQMADLDAQQADKLRPLLKASFPEGAWVLDETRLPARWMVYMGKYTQAEDLAKKRDQLNQLKVPFSPLNNTVFSPGFSLGVFSSEDAANGALQDVIRRGVRSAKVVQERPDILHYRLHLSVVSAADQAALNAIKAAMPGKTLDICPATTPMPAASASVTKSPP